MKNDNMEKKEPLKKSRTNAKLTNKFHNTYEKLSNISKNYKKKIIVNSNTKGNINSKPFKDIKISNIFEKKQKQKYLNKIINNTINEDKDLESLLSELKTTFQPTNTPDENTSKNKCEKEFIKLFNNDKIKDNNNNIEFIDLHFDLDDQGQDYDISQRVHKKNAKTYKKEKEQRDQKESKEKDINNIINPKKVISLTFIKKLKKNMGKGQILARKNSDSINQNIIKNNTSKNKNKKKNLRKNKTGQNNLINNTQIKNDDFGKMKKIEFKKSPNKKNANFFKMYKNSIVNSINSSNKAIISTPKNYAINKTITFENKNSQFGKKINQIKRDISKKIGELYIKNSTVKINNHKNNSKMSNIKRNKTYLNPFENNSYINDKYVRKSNSKF